MNPDEHTGDKFNMSLLKELLKDKADRSVRYDVEKGSDNQTQDIMSKEEKGTQSPFSNVTKAHPIEGKK